MDGCWSGQACFCSPLPPLPSSFLFSTTFCFFIHIFINFYNFFQGALREDGLHGWLLEWTSVFLPLLPSSPLFWESINLLSKHILATVCFPLPPPPFLPSLLPLLPSPLISFTDLQQQEYMPKEDGCFPSFPILSPSPFSPSLFPPPPRTKGRGIK